MANLKGASFRKGDTYLHTRHIFQVWGDGKSHSVTIHMFAIIFDVLVFLACIIVIVFRSLVFDGDHEPVLLQDVATFQCLTDPLIQNQSGK